MATGAELRIDSPAHTERLMLPLKAVRPKLITDSFSIEESKINESVLDRGLTARDLTVAGLSAFATLCVYPVVMALLPSIGTFAFFVLWVLFPLLAACTAHFVVRSTRAFRGLIAITCALPVICASTLFFST